MTDTRSIDGGAVDIDGRSIDWTSTTGGALSSLKAEVAARTLADRDTIPVRFRISLAGSGKLALVPLGKRTEATLDAPWPSPAHRPPALEPVGRQGRLSRQVDGVGTRPGPTASSGTAAARATIPRPAPCSARPSASRCRRRSTPIARRIAPSSTASCSSASTFAASLLFELGTGTRPHAAQYGLIGLSLCVLLPAAAVDQRADRLRPGLPGECGGRGRPGDDLQPRPAGPHRPGALPSAPSSPACSAASTACSSSRMWPCSRARWCCSRCCPSPCG